MAELARFTVREQGSVVFEIDDSGDGIRQAGLGRKGKVVDVQQTFENKLSDIRDAASAALSILKEDLSPDAVTLRFGIKMTVEAGAVVARTAVEGNMEVEMSWRRDEATAATTPKSSE
jgi:Trypsin-co-occurring domain 1